MRNPDEILSLIFEFVLFLVLFHVFTETFGDRARYRMPGTRYTSMVVLNGQLQCRDESNRTYITAITSVVCSLDLDSIIETLLFGETFVQA